MDTLQNAPKHLDAASLLTITVTLVLFGVAVVTKGFTHELLLEAAVFLVSVKLILMSYKISAANEQLRTQLDRIEGALKELPSNRLSNEAR